MGNKLLLTALAIYLIVQAFPLPAENAIIAIFAFIGIVLIWLDK